MTVANGPRSLHTALLELRWDGFQSAQQIAALLPRWSAATVAERLHTLAREGLVWAVVESGAKPVRRFARPRLDTAAMIVPSGRAVRRSWKQLRRSAA